VFQEEPYCRQLNQKIINLFGSKDKAYYACKDAFISEYSRLNDKRAKKYIKDAQITEAEIKALQHKALIKHWSFKTLA